MFFNRKKNKDKEVLEEKSIKVFFSYNNKILANAFQVLITFLGVIASIFICTTSYDIEISYFTITIFSLLFSILWCYIFSDLGNKKYKITASLLIVLIVCIILRKDLINGAEYIVSYISARIRFGNSIKFITDFNTEPVKLVEMVIIYFSMVLSAIFSLIIKYKPNIIICLLITFPLLELGIYNLILPSDFSFALMILFWLSIIAMQVSQKKERIKRKGIIVKNNSNWIKIKSGIIIILISASIFVISSLLYPKDKYVRDPKLDKLKVDIESFTHELTFESFKEIFTGKASGGINGGKLGRVDSLVYEDKVDLEVKVPVAFNNNKNIYLRGYSGAEYTGYSWKNASKEEYDKYHKKLTMEPLNILYNSLEVLPKNIKNNNELLEIYSSRLTVNNIDANSDYIYAPYGACYNENYFKFKRDEYASNNTENSRYSFNYYLLDVSNYTDLLGGSEYENNKEVEEILDNEEEYREYVYNTYTKLPEEGLNQIKNEFKGYSNEYSVYECIRIAQQKVLEGTKYDLSPGKLPEGTDFVEYFLYENKKGYCSHFSSAGAVILRSMGIPARYVEGYVIPNDEILAKYYDTLYNERDSSNHVDLEYKVRNYDKYLLDTKQIFLTLEEIDNENEVEVNKGRIINYKGKEYKICFSIVISKNNTSGLYSYEAAAGFDISNINIISDNSFEAFGSIYTFNVNDDLNIEYEKSGLIDESKESEAFYELSSAVDCVTVEVKDSNAHAWVEVYYDKIGWVPIEFTPASDYDDLINGDSKEKEIISKPEVDKDDKEEKIEDKIQEENDSKEDNAIKQEKEIKVEKDNKLLIILIILFISIVLLIIIRSRIKYILIKRSFKDKNKRKAARNIYNYILDIFKFLGNNVDDINSYRDFMYSITDKYCFIEKEKVLLVTDLLLKSEFSNNDLSDDEIRIMSNFSFELSRVVWKQLSRRRKVVFKLVSGLI